MTDKDQATLIKWSGATAGAAAGAYAGYKIAAKLTKNKTVGGVLGALALGGAVFAAIHYGTKTEVVAPPTDPGTISNPGASNTPVTERRATDLVSANIKLFKNPNPEPSNNIKYGCYEGTVYSSSYGTGSSWANTGVSCTGWQWPF